MALSLYQLEPLLREGITTINNVRSLDFRALTLKDVVTLVGLVYTAGKSVAIAWQLWKAVRQHGLSKVMRPNLKRKYGEWAVVTGCKRGVGSAYVRELAACGLNVVLISRPYPRLMEFADKIAKENKVRTCVVEVDVSDYENIFNVIAVKLEGKEIGILVNNVSVGRDTPNYFLDIPSEDLLSMININIIASTMATQSKNYQASTFNDLWAGLNMIHMILPQMIERGKGAIVVLASATSDTPSAELAVYGATKSYLDHFSESLRQEYSDQGVTIQLLKPYFIADGTVENIIPGGNILAPTPEKYVRGAVATLGWSENTTGYWIHTLQSWFRALLPQRGRQALSGWINELLRQANKAKLEPQKPASNVDGASFFAIFG